MSADGKERYEYTCPDCGDNILSYLGDGERCLCGCDLSPECAVLLAPVAVPMEEECDEL